MCVSFFPEDGVGMGNKMLMGCLQFGEFLIILNYFHSYDTNNAK